MCYCIEKGSCHKAGIGGSNPPPPQSPKTLQRHKPAILFAWEFQSLINIIKGNSKQQPVKGLLIFFMPFDIEWPITACTLLSFGGWCFGGDSTLGPRRRKNQDRREKDHFSLNYMLNVHKCRPSENIDKVYMIILFYFFFEKNQRWVTS